jgi:RNA polymerase sigma factor (sigma-70 family)
MGYFGLFAFTRKRKQLFILQNLIGYEVAVRRGSRPAGQAVHPGFDPGFLDRHVADAGADPAELLRDQRLRASLVNAIKSLPEREQYIMGMYYEHDMNLKEIAAVLGVTESRVCQLHSQSIARLRAKMRSH